MNDVAIIVGSITAVVYFFYILSKRKANDNRVNEKMKYVGYSDADLNKMHTDELRKIASEISNLRKDFSVYFMKAHNLEMGHKWANVGESRPFEPIEHFQDYEKELKKIRLEFEAESITKDKFDKKIITAQETLLRREWNIATTPLNSAEKLYNLKFITEKELMVVRKRVLEEEEKRELNKQKRENEAKTFYINYIKHNLLPE